MLYVAALLGDESTVLELEAEQAQAQQIALEQQLANSAISNGATSPPIPVAPQGQPGVAGGGVPV